RDVLALERDLGAHGRFHEAALAAGRDRAVGDLHRQIAGLDLRVALESHRGRAALELEVQSLDAIARGRAGRALRDVAHDPVLDADRGGEQRAGAGAGVATGAAAAARARRRLA